MTNNPTKCLRKAKKRYDKEVHIKCKPLCKAKCGNKTWTPPPPTLKDIVLFIGKALLLGGVFGTILTLIIVHI
jgi:hypothetical protein